MMENKVYIVALLVATVALAVLWLAALWFLNGTVRTENVYQEYVKRNILKQLHDKCSDGELIWILRHLKQTDDVRNMNRSEIRNKIVKIQSQQISQWEYSSDDERSIRPTINKICTQNYDTVIGEMEGNCTIQELHNICNHVNADEREQPSASKSDYAEDIINVKRTKIDLNVPKLIDKFCVERNLKELAVEIIASCSGGPIKNVFNKLIHKWSGFDVSCDECVEKMDFVEAVIEVKRRHYHQVRVKPLLDEFCIEPELKSLKRKLMESCSGVQVKQILSELEDKSTCGSCVEKTDFINALIKAKRLQFSKFNINPLIFKHCSET